MDAAAERRIGELKRDALEKLAREIAADARRFVPIDTGRLRDSIETTVIGDDTVRITASAENQQGDVYGGYVENGTSKMDAQPYMKPALYRRRSL